MHCDVVTCTSVESHYGLDRPQKFLDCVPTAATQKLVLKYKVLCLGPTVVGMVWYSRV